MGIFKDVINRTGQFFEEELLEPAKEGAKGALKEIAGRTFDVAELGSDIGSYLGKKAGQTDIGRKIGKSVVEKTGIKRETLQSVRRGMKEGVKEPEVLKPEGKAQERGALAARIAEAFTISGGTTKFKSAAQGFSGVGKRAGQEALEAYAVDKFQGRSADEARNAASIAAGMTVATPVAKIATRYIGNALNVVGGAISGKGSDVIETVFKNPEEAIKGMRSNEVDLLEDTANSIAEATQKLNIQAQKRYGQALKNLPEATTVQAGDSVISVGGNRYRLSMNDVVSRAKNQIEESGVAIRPDNTLDFSTSSFIGTEETAVKRMWDTVRTWDDSTPEGINDLASKLRKLRKSGDQYRQVNMLVDNVKHDTRMYIGDKIPDIAIMNRDYADKMDFLEAVEARLRTTRTGRPSRKQLIESTRKVQNIFGANKELVRNLAKELEEETGVLFLGKEAGRQLTDVVSRSGASIGDWLSNLAKAALPPRAVGEITAFMGKGNNVLRHYLDSGPAIMLKKAVDETRVPISIFVADLITTAEEAQEETFSEEERKRLQSVIGDSIRKSGATQSSLKRRVREKANVPPERETLSPTKREKLDSIVKPKLNDDLINRLREKTAL